MEDYSEDWREFRRLRRNLSLVWAFYTPALVILALVSYRLFRSYIPAFVAAVGWMLWFAIANAKFAQFSCPRCGKYFAGGPGLWELKMWLFARKCQHCGLEKFAGSNDDGAAAGRPEPATRC